MQIFEKPPGLDQPRQSAAVSIGLTRNSGVIEQLLAYELAKIFVLQQPRDRKHGFEILGALD
jgi:hypothetical protein